MKVIKFGGILILLQVLGGRGDADRDGRMNMGMSMALVDVVCMERRIALQDVYQGRGRCRELAVRPRC